MRTGGKCGAAIAHLTFDDGTPHGVRGRMTTLDTAANDIPPPVFQPALKLRALADQGVDFATS